jgi:hypothetical protein
MDHSEYLGSAPYFFPSSSRSDFGPCAYRKAKGFTKSRIDAGRRLGCECSQTSRYTTQLLSQPHTTLLTLLSGAAVRVTLYDTHTTRTSLRRGSTCSCTQSARASGPSLKSSSEATRGGRGGRIRLCCTALESAALQEIEAWPPKSDIGPGRLRHSSPWRRGGVGQAGGIHEPAGFAGERVGCVWDVSL